MLQQSRTIKGILVLWGLSLGMVIAGCGGGGDTSTPINQPPQNFATPAKLNKTGFSYSTGEPFDINPMLGEVLLFFGDFQGTNSAPFTLVARGFRATGRATFLNIYTLTVQESTFPAAQGPQVGDQLFIDFIDPTPRAQKVDVPPVNSNGVRDFTGSRLIGNPAQVNRNCVAKTGEGAPVDLGTLQPAGPGTPGGCIAVNGTINLQEAPLNMPSDTLKLTLQPSDQIVQFVLTFAVSTARDAADVDFDLFIRRTDNHSLLQSCVSSRTGQEACSIVLQQADFTAGSPLPITITVQSFLGSSGNNAVQGTGNYTLEILSNMSPEVGRRKNICPNTGPSVVLEQEPNGRSVFDLSRQGYFLVLDTPPSQDVGTLRVPTLTSGCIPIRGGHIGASIIDAVFDPPTSNVLNQAAADGIDNFEFSVENTVTTVAFFLTPTNLNNLFRLFIDEPPTTPQGSFTRLAACQTAIIRPSTPVVACAVAVPSSRKLRVGVFPTFVCPDRTCTTSSNPITVESDYSLDIIAVVLPSIPVTPIGTASAQGGIITPVTLETR